MSAFISLKYENSIQLLTEGAVYSSDGTLQQVKSKCEIASKVPLAVTGRGSTDFCDIFVSEIIKIADSGGVDRCIAWLSDYLTRRVDWLAHIEREGKHFEILLCAFSETRGLFHTVFTSHGERPFVLYDQPFMCVAAPDLTASELTAMTNKTPLEDERFLKNHGVEMMEIMRRDLRFKGAGGKVINSSTLGGLCQLTSVTSAGASTQILHCWDDVIGEPINPYRSHGNVAPMVRKSRKERRSEATGQAKRRRFK